MCQFIKVFKLHNQLVNGIEMLYVMSDLISYIRDRVGVEQVSLIFSAVQCKLSCCTVLVCLWPQECLLALTRQYLITVKILQSTYKNMTTLWCHEIYNPHSQTLQLTVGQIVWRSYGCRVQTIFSSPKPCRPSLGTTQPSVQ